MSDKPETIEDAVKEVLKGDDENLEKLHEEVEKLPEKKGAKKVGRPKPVRGKRI